MQSLREIMQMLRASPVFVLAVLITLGLAGLNGLMVVLMNLAPDVLPRGFAQMGHFSGLDHRVHDLTFGFLFVPTVVGMLAQLRRPAKNVAGQLITLVPLVGLVLTLVLTFVLSNNANVVQPPWLTVGAAALIASVLHPAGRNFFRSFNIARINWVMLSLVMVAAVPLLVFASTNIGRQGTVNDDHAALGHYGFMAAFAVTVIGVGLLASLRPDGWRVTAWVAGLLPALLGIASVLYPDVSTSLGLVWALAAIVWGIGFVAAAELIPMAVPAPSPAAGVAPDRGSPPGPPRWVQLSGVIGLLAVLLFVSRIFTGGGSGGGPGGHTPPAGVTTASGDAGVGDGEDDDRAGAPPTSVPESGEADGHTPPIQHGP